MAPRENLLSLLKRQGYDSVPAEFMLCPSLVESYRANEKSDQDYRDFFKMPWRRLPDLVPDNGDKYRFSTYHSKNGLDPSSEIDLWGVGHRATESSMHMTQMFSPLKGADSVEQIESYPLPVFSAAGNPGLESAANALRDSGLASVGNMQCTVWETSWYIRGMENLMMDMMCEDPMAESLLDRITGTAVSMAELYAAAGADILFLGDDVGTQKSLMMSMDMYVTWLKPRLKRVIDAARLIKPDIVVFYHSCGYVEPLIPHFIEAGVDVLNPVQPECMDFEEIYRAYGNRLSFHGTIGTQTVMPFGTPEEVKANVWRNLDIAGEAGGLFPAPTHLLEPEVPWENIRAYVEACQEYTR